VETWVTAARTVLIRILGYNFEYGLRDYGQHFVRAMLAEAINRIRLGVYEY